jgi:AraC-like DNA-binding protein
VSTRGLPPSQRLPTLQALFEAKVQLNFAAASDQPLEAEMTVQGLPGLRHATMVSNIDVCLERPHPLLADGEDDVCLIVKNGGGLAIQQQTQQATARDGDGVLLVYRRPANLQFRAMDYSAIRVPFASLSPAIRNIEDAAARCIPGESQALRMLQTYVAHLPAAATDPQLAGLVVTHVCDLIALALGATGDGRVQAEQRGLRAARLQAIMADVERETGLTLEAIARRQAVSPRYIQMLFEEAGTTFTAFVLESRLERARAMLNSPRYAGWPITEVALETGFGDISYFNRRFRQRYDMTPTDMRAQAKGPRAADDPSRTPGPGRRRPRW